MHSTAGAAAFIVKHWTDIGKHDGQLDSPNSGPALLSSEYSEISYSTSSQSIALKKKI